MRTIYDPSALDAFLASRTLRARGVAVPLVHLWRSFKTEMPPGWTRDLFVSALVARGVSLVADGRGQTIACGVALVEEPVAA